MTEETPQSEGSPSPATPEEAPTAETTPLAPERATPPPAEAPTQAAPVAPAAAAAPAAATAPTTTTARPAGIFIPKWVGLVAAAIVAALIFGGIGYAIGDSSSDSSSTENASNTLPNGNGTQTFPGGGQLPNGGQLPGGDDDRDADDDDGPIASNAGFLGVGVAPTTDDQGVTVTEVAADSPAAEAGLQEGDVITAIDGEDVTSPLAVRSAVQAKESGDEISVTYTRNGQSTTVDVTLTSRSQAQSS
jgi:putative serine protease PepD